MARLRALYVGTKTVGDVSEDQHILVLDDLNNQVTPEQEAALNKDLGQGSPDGVPPILAFGFPVDLPAGDKLTQDAIDHLKEDVEADEVEVTNYVDGGDRRYLNTVTGEIRTVPCAERT